MWIGFESGISKVLNLYGGDATLPGSVCARLAVTKHVEMAAKSQNTGDSSSVITGAGRSSIY